MAPLKSDCSFAYASGSLSVSRNVRSLAASLLMPAPIEFDTMARSRPIASSSALRRASALTQNWSDADRSDVIRAANSFSASRPASPSISAMTTAQPSASRRRATARPIPWPPPVTTAHLRLPSVIGFFPRFLFLYSAAKNDSSRESTLGVFTFAIMVKIDNHPPPISSRFPIKVL